MKHLPNVISVLRIAGSIGLLFCDVTGLLLFLAAPTMFWSMIPIALVASLATFAAVQEGHLIMCRKMSMFVSTKHFI